MSQTLIQSVAAEVMVVLTLDNEPVTGLAHTDVVLQYRKAGASSFTTKTLSADDWDEIGDGVYAIDFTAAELNTLKNLTVKVTGADIDQFVTFCTVVAAASGSTAVSVETCILSGHVFDAAGSPVEDATISVRILGRPSIEQNAAAITDDMISAKTDANGEFFISLVRLCEVEIFIPVANYRRVVTVPNAASANLFTEVV